MAVEAAAQGDPHDGLAAALAEGATASSAARSSTRWARTWSRSAWSWASTTGTCRCRCTISAGAEDPPRVRKILEGGERIAWGAKTIPGGRLLLAALEAARARSRPLWRRRRLRERPALKGIHYAVESGVLAAEAIVGALRPGEAIGRAGALPVTTTPWEPASSRRTLKAVRNMGGRSPRASG